MDMDFFVKFDNNNGNVDVYSAFRKTIGDLTLQSNAKQTQQTTT